MEDGSQRTCWPPRRLGRWTARHVRPSWRRAWRVVAGRGSAPSPRGRARALGRRLAGDGSESVEARELVEETSAASRASADGRRPLDRRSSTVRPRPSADGRRSSARSRETTRSPRRPPRPGVRSRATATPPSSRPARPRRRTRWSAPPTSSRASWRALGGAGVEVALTGASGMWSDFNEANKEAMLKSELISWPVTLAILVLAFGSLVAAGPAADADDPRPGRLGRRRSTSAPRCSTSRSGP